MSDIFNFLPPHKDNRCDKCGDKGVYLFPVIPQRIITKRVWKNKVVYDQDLVVRFVCKNCRDSL